MSKTSILSTEAIVKETIAALKKHRKPLQASLKKSNEAAEKALKAGKLPVTLDFVELFLSDVIDELRRQGVEVDPVLDQLKNKGIEVKHLAAAYTDVVTQIVAAKAEGEKRHARDLIPDEFRSLIKDMNSSYRSTKSKSTSSKASPASTKKKRKKAEPRKGSAFAPSSDLMARLDQEIDAIERLDNVYKDIEGEMKAWIKIGEVEIDLKHEIQCVKDGYGDRGKVTRLRKKLAELKAKHPKLPDPNKGLAFA